MNDNKIQTSKYEIYLNNEELSGEIYFTLFDKRIEAYSNSMYFEMKK